VNTSLYYKSLLTWYVISN